MKKPQTMNSIRLMMLIICLVVPLNLITLILSGSALQGMIGMLRESTEGTQLVCVNQMDSAMKAAAARAKFISTDQIDYLYLSDPRTLTEGDTNRQIQSSVNLMRSYNDYISENRWLAGMYAIFPNLDIRAVQDNRNSYSLDKEAMLAYIDGRIREERRIGGWECRLFDSGAKLIYMSRFRGSYFGAWFDLEYLVRAMELNRLDTPTWFTDGEGTVLSSPVPCTEEDPVKSLLFDSHLVEVSTSSSLSGLMMHQRILPERILETIPPLTEVFFVLSLLAVFALPVILFFMRRWIIQPVRRLNDAMEQISSGNMDFRIEERSTASEFDRMNRAFNHMMEEISRLKIDVYEEQLEKQDIRLKFLSQQIRPHFILNTLNILYSYEQDEYPLIQKMILCLSRYFRYIVNANVDEVPLKAEMEHIRNYFEIQTARYPDTFFAFVEYEESIASCLVPPLLIQNFAENSIKHSIKIGNRINIFVIAQPCGDSRVRIRMLDTGEGIDEELIRKINRFQETGVRQEGLGIGIQNAIERLNVLYGADTKFSIARDEPHGTRIEIILPLKQGEAEDD